MGIEFLNNLSAHEISADLVNKSVPEKNTGLGESARVRVPPAKFHSRTLSLKRLYQESFSYEIVRPSFYFYSRAQSTSDNRNENLKPAPYILLAVGENYGDNRNENSTLLAAQKKLRNITRNYLFYRRYECNFVSRQTDLNLNTNGSRSDLICPSCSYV